MVGTKAGTAGLSLKASSTEGAGMEISAGSAVTLSTGTAEGMNKGTETERRSSECPPSEETGTGADCEGEMRADREV
ncbi:hypothetical protein B0H17DRAFT_1028947 [Mycena rosella]|uniref:Uncharacterized protein n=1 Tax=Mycena rosella TaxID=1033263 RepID=A0AAD7H1F2_MYCRO|nr:hypothetical protein B0H17DRAFT_1028947 [Mycena rosella]